MLDPTPLHQLNPTDRFSNRVTDYAQHRPSYPAAVIDAILDRGDFLDLAGLIGLARSRSYTPQSGVAHEQLVDRLTQLFNEFCQDGQVAIVYQANVYLARGR